MKNKSLKFLTDNGYIVLKNIFTKQKCQNLKDLCIKINQKKYIKKIKKLCTKSQLKLLGFYLAPPKDEYERINALKDV